MFVSRAAFYALVRFSDRPAPATSFGAAGARFMGGFASTVLIANRDV